MPVCAETEMCKLGDFGKELVVIRIVNRRTAGRIETGTVRVYIGRPSQYGNPYVIGRDGSRDEVIRRYRTYILGRGELIEELRQLAKNGNVELECWCWPESCHGDVLKELIEE